MALVQYRGDKDDNRSRKSSPVVKKFFYQELFKTGRKTLVRSFSCQQYSNVGKKGEVIMKTKVKESSVWSLEGKNRRRRSGKGKTQTSLWIDIYQCLSYILPLLFITYFVYLFTTQPKVCEFDINSIERQLTDSVFGQADAVGRIVGAFQTVQSESVVVQVWTGGSGVGKTLVSSIIQDNLPSTIQLQVIFSTRPENVQVQFPDNTCNKSVIIFEDVLPSSLAQVANFVLSITHQQLDQNIIVLILCQTQTPEEVHHIIQFFQYQQIAFEHVPFRYLTQEDIKACFKAEIANLNVQIEALDLEQLVEKQMQFIPESNGKPGCKGVKDRLTMYLSKPNVL